MVRWKRTLIVLAIALAAVIYMKTHLGEILDGMVASQSSGVGESTELPEPEAAAEEASEPSEPDGEE
jgi:hypothetical protein